MESVSSLQNGTRDVGFAKDLLHVDLLDIVQRAQNGEQAAMAELWRRHHSHLFHVAFEVLHDHSHADDLLQEAYLHLSEKISTLTNLAAITKWLRRSVRNMSINALRKMKTRREVSLSARSGRLPQEGRPYEFADSNAPNPIHELIEQDEKELFESAKAGFLAALEGMNDSHKQALFMHYLLSMKIRDIATMVGRPEGTVKRHLHEGRKKALEILQDTPIADVAYSDDI